MNPKPNKKEIEEFSNIIFEYAEKYQCNHIDAVCYYCNDIGMEIETTPSLISQALKAKIKEDAEELNLLKKKTSKLPI